MPSVESGNMFDINTTYGSPENSKIVVLSRFRTITLREYLSGAVASRQALAVRFFTFGVDHSMAAHFLFVCSQGGEPKQRCSVTYE